MQAIAQRPLDRGRFFAQRARAALRALRERCSAVSFAALALPPRRAISLTSMLVTYVYAHW